MRSDDTQLTNWGEENHPSTEMLQQYEDGLLADSLNYQLERHLLDCEMCTDMLEGMSLTDRARTRKAVRTLGYRIRNRLRKHRKRAAVLHGLSDWRVAIAVLMMFCSLGLIIFFQYTKQTPPPEVEQLPDFDKITYPVTEFELILPERHDVPLNRENDTLQDTKVQKPLQVGEE